MTTIPVKWNNQKKAPGGRSLKNRPFARLFSGESAMPTPSSGMSRNRKCFTLGIFALGAVTVFVVCHEAVSSNAFDPAVTGTDKATSPRAASSANETAMTLHDNLALDESALSADGRRLTFGLLEQWTYTLKRPPPVPEAVRRIDGLEQELSGFMFPLETGSAIRNFCLLRTTQTCCYGPIPQFNQYVLVEMEKPVPLVAGKPVTVTGRFHVDPQPEDGYIYRMEGLSVNDTPSEALTVIAQ